MLTPTACDAQVTKRVLARTSVRAYDGRPLARDDQEAVEGMLARMQDGSPFPARITASLLEAGQGADAERLGTYGVIRGARSFIGLAVQDTPGAMEALGYAFEKVVLGATARGLGTCWLAGTFKRRQFEGAMELAEDDLFPIVCPIGYPSGKGSLVNSVFRKVGGSDHRKPWDELFFDGEFGVPLPQEAAGPYAFPLEMLRLAPSAANRQPWRVVRTLGAFHFFREANPKSKYPYDLQRLDVGIGACHFHLAAAERGLPGHFDRTPPPHVGAPSGMAHLFSWVEE